MRFGIAILTDQPWAQAAPKWAAAEQMGFDHAWTYDHLVWEGLRNAPWRGALPTLAAAAGVTTSIQLGTLVSAPNFRHPYALFRDAQALADLSGGRFILGIGNGGDIDNRVLGGPELTTRQRVERFYEFARLLDRLRREDHVDHDGHWFSTSDARTLPGLSAPLLVAANGPRSVRFAAGIGDAWITTGPRAATVDEWLAGVAASVEVFDEAVAGAERPRYLLLDSAPNPLSSTGRVVLSSVGLFEDVLGRADHLGFTDVVLAWPRAEAPYAADERVLEQVAAEVMPQWRS